MAIFLYELFATDGDGNILKDENGIAQFNPHVQWNNKPITCFQDFLNTLDHVADITQDSDENPAIKKIYVIEFTKLLLQKFKEHLRETQKEWYDHKFNPKIYTVAKQLEAFTYLTGEHTMIREILEEFPYLQSIKADYQKYENNNFLNNEESLKFSNFDRSLLVIQMGLRVLDPRFIQQRQDQVCGVNAYVHNIALFNPLQYVEMLGGLAEKGEIDLQDISSGRSILNIKATKNVTDKKRAKNDRDEIHDADHIILNGLRASENAMVSYTSKGAELSKQLFGVTTPNELQSWLQQSDYKNVQTIPIHTRTSIKQLHQLMQEGIWLVF